MEERCSLCKFWGKYPYSDHTGLNVSSCKRRSPVVLRPDNNVPVWPMTEENMWCGDFLAKEKD